MRKIDYKICCVCRKEKHISGFYKKCTSIDGLRSQCSECYKKQRLNFKSTIIKSLCLENIPKNQIPPELIDLKIIQLKIKRELKNGVQNENKN